MPETTRHQPGEFLDSIDYTEAEKWVIKWQCGLLGDFQTALAKAIALADDNNLDRLAAGFPTQVRGFRAWNSTDLGQRLRKAGLEI